jgi:hypothetical protein
MRSVQRQAGERLQVKQSIVERIFVAVTRGEFDQGKTARGTGIVMFIEPILLCFCEASSIVPDYKVLKLIAGKRFGASHHTILGNET